MWSQERREARTQEGESATETSKRDLFGEESYMA